jgi:hypothetical protein
MSPRTCCHWWPRRRLRTEIVSGDDEGGIRLWIRHVDDAQLDKVANVSGHGSRVNNSETQLLFERIVVAIVMQECVAVQQTERRDEAVDRSTNRPPAPS